MQQAPVKTFLSGEEFVDSYRSDNPFDPSLNFYIPLRNARSYSCPMAEDMASRMACLPPHPDLPSADIKRIAKIILDSANV